MAEAILAVKNIYLKHRDLFLLVTKIITAAGLLTFILYSVNINRTVSVFENSDKFFLSAAFLLSFVNIYLQYLKWKLVCGCIIGENKRSKIINSLFYGFTAGSFTPARIGEYVGRALPFTDKPLLKITSAVFIDKSASLLIVSFNRISFISVFHKRGNTVYLNNNIIINTFILPFNESRIFNALPEKNN